MKKEKEFNDKHFQADLERYFVNTWNIHAIHYGKLNRATR